jgi:hypothetical protein
MRTGSLQSGCHGTIGPPHYRTFIYMHANPGVDCVLACEFVTAAYLMTKVLKNPI